MDKHTLHVDLDEEDPAAGPEGVEVGLEIDLDAALDGGGSDVEFLDDDDIIDVLSGETSLVGAEAPLESAYSVPASVSNGPGSSSQEAIDVLEARLAEVRGELGARIAELEGELEALGEERGAWSQELDELHGELEQRSLALAEARAQIEALRDGGASRDESMRLAEEERAALRLQADQLSQDRERIQDELAAQIAEIAGELAGRDQQIASLQRRVQQLLLRVEELVKERKAPVGAPSIEAEEEIARLKGELEDLAAENGFLSSEVDRYAAQAAQRQTKP